MVDVEADGSIPGDYSMVQIGAIVVEPSLSKTFFGKLCPISNKWEPDALKSCNLTHEETLTYDNPLKVMTEFSNWLKSFSGRPMFVSDNNGFDWMFCHWYFIHFLGNDPFGYSSTNLGSLYKGCVRNIKKNFKFLRKTKHTHNPVDDAKGNAEAMLEIFNQYKM